MLTIEDGWLAGMIEGEATIDLKRGAGRNPRLRIRIKMVDEDIVARIAQLWGASYYERPNGRWQRQYETEIAGRRAEDLCARLMPLFGKRRRAAIESALKQRVRAYERRLAH